MCFCIFSYFPFKIYIFSVSNPINGTQTMFYLVFSCFFFYCFVVIISFAILPLRYAQSHSCSSIKFGISIVLSRARLTSNSLSHTRKSLSFDDDVVLSEIAFFPLPMLICFLLNFFTHREKFAS